MLKIIKHFLLKFRSLDNTNLKILSNLVIYCDQEIIKLALEIIKISQLNYNKIDE